MSRFGLPLRRRIASTMENLRGKFGRKAAGLRRTRKPRRLQIDPLEERTLLSLSPGDWEDIQVTEGISYNQTTGRFDVHPQYSRELVSQSLAADNDGDFVVVWTRFDPVLDPVTGQQMVDAQGNPRTEANIYARYFTDEVQRITLPRGVLTNADPGSYARFSLTYGDPGAQKLTITSAYQPGVSGQQNIQGTITIAFQPPGGGLPQTQVWFYDETRTLQELQTELQAQIQNFGGVLADATVQALNPHEFVINYGSAAAGQNPKISIQTFSLSGFLPAVQVSTVRQPTVIANIPISPDNPALTAQAIEQYFWQTQQTKGMGPTELPPPDRVPPEGPYSEPEILSTAVPLVTVTPVLGLVDAAGQSLDGLVFDVTFGGRSSNVNLTNTSGKKDHPPLVISAVVDESGVALTPPAGSVKTLKEPSREFRVNPPEPDDPFTYGPDGFDQINPSVAMDADGDFVIVWESKIPESQIPGSVSDIYARRFSPIGLVDDPASVRGMMRDANGNFIQGIKTYYDDVQTLRFNVGTGRVTGTFRLQVGDTGTPTNVIDFDSSNPTGNAAAIEAALVAAGYQGATVRALNNSNPYQFQVTFGGLSGGVNQPKLVYVPELNVQGQPTLPGTVTVIDSEPDGDPVAVGAEDISTFRVNTNTARPQFQPSVGMDEAGNFTIAWATGGQDMSFFNHILMQRFGRRGERLGNEVQLTLDDTVVYFEPFVAMSNDGQTVVTWSRTANFEYFTNGVYAVGTFASLFAPNGTPIAQRFGVIGGGGAAAAFDSANNLIITADALFDGDSIGGTSMGVHAIMYRPDGSVLRPEFRVNSASLTTGGTPFWPLYQTLARPAIDADGDLAITYEGFGADVSQNLYLSSTRARDLLRREINATKNADLRQFFDPATESLPIFDFNQGTSGDIDSELEAVMIRAWNRVGKNPTADQLKQLGRLYAILNSVAGQLRGEANGALFSRFDADPVSGQYTTVFSDSVANAQRDGHNDRWILKIDGNATQGDFTIRLYHSSVSGYEDITVTPVYYNNGPVNPAQTRAAIETALRGAQRTGTNWPYNYFEGPVTVRQISNSAFGGEKQYRDGTPYDLDNLFFSSIASNDLLYEITFQGEVHDTQMYMYVTRHNMQVGNTATYSPEVETYMTADEGTLQTFVAIDMQPDGSFVTTWTQQERNTSGGSANQNIYYRRFVETVDTAGPRLIELMDADGTWIDDQGAVDRPARFIIVTFDEEMMTTGLDSVTNPDNWELLKNGVPLLGGIKAIHYGMNKSAELAANNPARWQGLNRLPTNKYEAVIELDGNGFDPDPNGVTPELSVGVYTIRARTPVAATGTTPARSGLRDRQGNPLGFTGFTPAGQDFQRVFVVNQPVSAALGDTPVTGVSGGNNARTYPETPGAVAVDADGDYVVVWTATDPATGLDRVYMRLFDSDGTPADMPLADPITRQPILDGQGNPIVSPDSAPVLDVTPITFGSPFNQDDQRYASVAVDADGDIIVTWTNFRDEDGLAANGREQADIYARRFNALGGLVGVSSSGAPVFDAGGSGEAFRVNTTTASVQKWSSVAADVDGDFVVTWSSLGQEGSGGTGYGIYAQRFNSYGDKVGGEFRVNASIAGNQQYSSVAMDAQGGFVITWTTDPTGTNADIMARVFGANGDPVTGEFAVPITTAGNQKYADVAMDLSGDNFVVAWQSAAQDGDGYGVYARTFTRAAGTFVPSSAELRVNTTTAGNQMYPSVAMSHQGNFVVTWSGRGEQTGQRDTSGIGGVYTQRFDVTAGGVLRVGGETRLNNVTNGNQWVSSIGSDGEGNYVVVWTGIDPANVSRTLVFGAASVNMLPIADADGPIVTGVTTLDNTRLAQDDVIQPAQPGLESLKVLFGESLSMVGDAGGANSVINPANWLLLVNGGVMPGAIANVTFTRNALTRKYEATVQFDGNGLDSGVVPLAPGEYVLVARDAITDGVNALDGNYDGVPGTAPRSGYEFRFTVLAALGVDDEFRINVPTPPDQTFSTPLGTGTALEQSSRTVAVDHDGDFVVVWMVQTASGTDIMARVYDRNNVPLTGEIAVNTVTAGQQRNAAVACDADGDFVVVWESQGEDPDGSWGVYARRFSSMGVPLGAPFRVNATTQYDQVNPAVAMDDFGRFVVVWATAGTNYGYFNDIRGQVFDSRGEKVGSEFQASTPVVGLNTVAGLAENNPAVAMNGRTGDFVVVWDEVTAQAARRVVDTQVFARLYSANGTAQGAAFRADNGPGAGGTSVARTARNPQVAMNDNGSFLLVWESFGVDDPGPASYGVFYRGFDATGTPTGGGQINDALFAGQQVNATVATDANGGFTVAFNGAGAQPDPFNPGNPNLATQFDAEGVFFRQFDAQFNPVEVQRRANQTEGGVQQFPSVGVTRDGDPVIVWSGSGVGDRQGIFGRRFRDTLDAVGATISDVVSPKGNTIPNGGQVAEDIEYLVVTFDEEMLVGGANGVTNPANYQLLRNGVGLTGAIQQIAFGLNQGSAVLPGYPQTNKWEAVIAIDGNGTAAGDPRLSEGRYELVISRQLRDINGNPLNRTNATPNGANTIWVFNVAPPAQGETLVNDPPGNQRTESPQSTASDADGDYVVVWTSDQAGRQGVYAKLYQTTWVNDPAGGRRSATAEVEVLNPATGQPWFNNEILVTAEPTASFASVARDADGDFVVTWSQQDLDGSGQKTDWNIYARRYTAAGQPLGEAFRVNSVIDTPALRYSVQRYSQVAMDTEGDFVITWQSLGQDGSGYGIYAQRYSPAGNPLGGVNEIQLLTFMTTATLDFQLGWDRNGDGFLSDNEKTPLITFAGSAYAVVDEVRSALAALGAEVEVRAVSQREIQVQFVGRDGSRDVPLLVPISSGLRVQVQAEGKSGEFRVNDTTLNNQTNPSIAMDADGDFVITWTSQGQNGEPGSDTDIYAKKFISNRFLRGANLFGVASGFSSTDTSVPLNEAEGFVVTVDDPANHVVRPGSGVDGIVQVNVGGAFSGTGALLWTGHHILTAAHLVWPTGAAAPLPANQVTVTFNMPSSTGTGTTPVTMAVSQVFISPNYNPTAVGLGGDIAVLTLVDEAPALAQRFNLYRGSDEVGRVGTLYGYGDFGTGDVGNVNPADNQNRTGQNRYEATGLLIGLAPDLLVYDFDNGLAANDAFGTLYGLSDLGLGTLEAASAPGDSGAPVFINGLIAAVVTGGVTSGSPDFLAGTNSSFGDIGFDTRVSVYADWIDNAIQANTLEFLVSQPTGTLTYTVGNQKWSTVAMDADGDFVVTWTSYGQDAPGSSYGYGSGGQNGVFARRFDATGTPAVAAPNEFQVNSFAEGNQQRSSVSMDADGDFVVAWESFQDGPTGGGTPDSYGIYVQRYARTSQIGANPFLGPNGEIGGQLRVNTTTAGDQRYPSVAMDHAGDFVVAWSGNGTQPGQVDAQGVFFQRFESIADEAGPVVADVLNVVTLTTGGTTYQHVRESSILNGPVTRFVIDLGEDLNQFGGVNGVHSILNPNNWSLARNNVVLSGGIADVQFGYNALTKKFEATVTFDGDASQAGFQPLASGEYVLTLRDRVWDLFDNAFDGNYDGAPGGDFRRKFTVVGGDGTVPGGDGPGDPTTDEDDRVNNTETGVQNDPAVASDADGNYVVVWVTYGQAPDLTTEGNILGQRYNRAGQRVGPQFLVSSFSTGSQIQPDVAMDRFGNFVVVWSGQGQVGQGANAVIDDRGVWARVFNADGNPLGTQFLVNQTTIAIQDQPAVAMDAQGNFVVTWSSNAATLDHYGIWARRFSSAGVPLSGEFLANATINPAQTASDVAMDDDGNFVVVWQSDGQDGVGWGVYGQRFDANGNMVGAEFRVNDYTASDQVAPQVAMDADGDFAVVWSSFLQDGSGYGVYAKRYNRLGQALTGDVRINQLTEAWQYQPAVSMSDSGMAVVTWTAQNQDQLGGHNDGVFARVFNPDGSDLVNPATGLPYGEFRVNAVVVGHQNASAVAMDADGDFTAVWVGPDADQTGVYQRRVRLNPDAGSAASSFATQFSGSIGWSGGWTVDPMAGGPTSMSIVGTPGDDVFVFELGATPSTWNVLLNGVRQSVDYRTALLSYDGRGGNDTIQIVGTAAREQIEIHPGRLVINGNGFGFTAANVETITYDGRGGADEITLYDTDGADTVVLTPPVGSTPLAASMVGGGYTTNVRDVRSVVVYSNGHAQDTVRFNDNPNLADTFTAWPSAAMMVGTGYSLRANAFRNVQAVSTGGNDVAQIFDGAGDDTFTATTTSAVLTGSEAGMAYSRTATGFRRVYAIASSGGHDTAVLEGTAASGETLVAYPTHAILSGAGFFRRADGFENIEAYSGGGNDSARFYGSDFDDAFVAEPGLAVMSSALVPYRNTAHGFRNVVAFAGGGNDSATLQDNPSANDNFVSVHGAYAELTDGISYRARAEQFESVTALSRGGADTARLYDAQGKQILVADPTYAQMSGGGFVERVEQFRFTHSYATPGGGDEAELRDSALDTATVDVFQAGPDRATMFAGSYLNRVLGFGTVKGISNAGNDRAVLTDSASQDYFVADPQSGTLSGTVGGRTFANTAVGFAELTAVSTNGGNDEARLKDSALSDLIQAEGNWAKVANLNLNFVRKTVGFKKVTAESHNATDTILDTAARDFLFTVEKYW
ncbi:MAG: S1 family peptidase [Thermoguttaceae bacterium]|nr:S1 family peptidase [Thermoguttaceae bacterium]